jgi:hypothetical protein
MAKKTIKGVKVPRRIMGYKLRKGTRKDIAGLVRAIKHPDAKTLIAAVVAALGPIVAERLTHKKPKLKAVR